MNEVWKHIKGYENSYQISSEGRVKSLPRVQSNGSRLQGLIMLPIKTTKGYSSIGLRDGTKRRSFLIHRLVALAFLDNPQNKEQVNHKDGNKKNNTLNNLEWATSSENIKHSFESGLNSQQGERHASNKLTEKQVREIRVRYDLNEPLGEIAKDYNVGKSSICCIGKRTRWKHV